MFPIHNVWWDNLPDQCGLLTEFGINYFENYFDFDFFSLLTNCYGGQPNKVM